MQDSVRKQPQVVFLAGEDWANVSYNFYKALEKAGVPALALSKKPITWYDNQAKIYFKPEVEVYPVCFNAKWVIWMHSVFTPLPDQIINNRAIKFGVFHGGTAYRTGYQIANQTFNPRVDLTFIQTLEMWNLGAKDPKRQLIPPVDTDLIQPAPFYEGGRKIRVAHFPRSAGVKGSASINKVLNNLTEKGYDFDYLYSEDIVSWEENIERIKACDIYIEQAGTGYWSVTAMEAAALGKVVVAPFDHQEIYIEEHGLHGGHGITFAQNEAHMEEVIENLLNEEDLAYHQKQARDWVENVHSFEATGNRLKTILDL